MGGKRHVVRLEDCKEMYNATSITGDFIQLNKDYNRGEEETLLVK